jgi:hypothetical protein
MPILSSRPSAPVRTHDDVLRAARPTINILNMLSDFVKLSDGSIGSMTSAQRIVLDALEAMELEDYAVIPLPGPVHVVVFEIMVQPFDAPDRVVFRIAFDVV